MEIQNLIKINQTNILGTDQARGLLRSQHSGELFDGILAIFTNVLQSSDTKENQPNLPLQENEKFDDTHSDQSVSECSQEVILWQLEEILTDWLVLLNHSQQQFNNKSENNEIPIEEEHNQLQQTSVDWANNRKHLYSKTEVVHNPTKHETESNEIPSHSIIESNHSQRQHTKIETKNIETTLHIKNEVAQNQGQPSSVDRENNESQSNPIMNVEQTQNHERKIIDFSPQTKNEEESNQVHPTSINWGKDNIRSHNNMMTGNHIQQISVHTENLDGNKTINESEDPLPLKWMSWQQSEIDVRKKGIVQLPQTVIDNRQQQAIETISLIEKFNQFRDRLNRSDNHLSQDMVTKVQLLLDRLNTSISKSNQKTEDGWTQYIQKPRVSFDKNELFFPDNGMSFVGNRVPIMDTNYVHTNQNSLPKMSLAQFIPEMESWISQYKLQHGQFGRTEAQFLLTPDQLGRLEVTISTQEGKISAQIVTETAAAKEVLEGQLQQLKQVLQQQGIQIQKMEIIQSPISTDISQWSLSFSHHGSSNHSKQEKGKNQLTQVGVNKFQEVDQEISNEAVMTTYGYATRRTISSIDFTA
ncbi:flagellar hook-length control protein FliK [Neobacillus thermocopriae]|uniref:flagellar hook-length control protein FliK n=1 Tax=Neobacillus thermocopriae TaxID=1215031 RepID=UPI002E22F462|nr:flagellar hook-length control protein FliK [Neobacillus thermocopriae]MED3713775.1 flagellar hook-length control protein FliK [Neobacillus thermocopriae]